MTLPGCRLPFTFDFKERGLLGSCFLEGQGERCPVLRPHSLLGAAPSVAVSRGPHQDQLRRVSGTPLDRRGLWDLGDEVQFL